MSPPSRVGRPPWWQDLRWIAAGMLLACAATLLWGLFGPEPPIRVSRETTFLTAPLAADGLPDYGAAILASQGPAPAPEDNAAVEILQVMWPMDINDADLPLVCKELGIAAVAPAESLGGLTGPRARLPIPTRSMCSCRVISRPCRSTR